MTQRGSTAVDEEPESAGTQDAGSGPATPVLRASSAIPKWLILGGALVTVGYLTLTPVVFLLWRMVTDQDGFLTGANLTQAYTDTGIADLTVNTLVFVFGATAVGMGTGTALAYVHARTNIRFKRALLILSLGPLVLPGLLYTTAWILLGARRSGILNMMTDQLFGVRPFDIYSMPGMIWVEGVSLSPLCYLLMLAGFYSMDHSLEEAAFASGARLPRVLRKAVQTISGKGFAPRPRELSRGWRVCTEVVVLVFLVATIILPTLTLIYSSLLPLNMVPSEKAFQSMSLDNYRAVLEHDAVRTGTVNSLILAPASATAVMALVSIAAWIVIRTRVRGRGIFDVLTLLPITVPGIALGLSLLVVYLRVPLPIYGTLAILFVAYVTKFLPFGMRFATTSMYQVHSDLEESALVSGASWTLTFRRVILPLVMPGIVAGWVYVAMVSVRELSSSVLVYSPGSEVIGVAMWQLSVATEYNQLAALGNLMILALCVLATIAQVARRYAGAGFERGGGL